MFPRPVQVYVMAMKNAVGLAVVLAALLAAAPHAQRKDAVISSGWVAVPAAGARQTQGYLVVDNPTAYDLSLLKVSSDVAGSVELRASGRDEALTFVTVAAYESLEMTPKGTYLLLKDVKRPLAEGDKVRLSVETSLGAPLTVEAAVRKKP